MRVAYPGLSATLRAEHREAVRAVRRSALDAAAGRRWLLAVNVFGVLLAFGVLMNNALAFWLLHVTPVWTSYIGPVLVPIANTRIGMSLVDHIRSKRAGRAAR